ncbi:AAA family ATPase [Bacteroides sp.]
MRLNHVEIEYFRCFKQYIIDFAPGITVLIGKNGAGKSTLINAMHKALSFIFYKNTSAKEEQTITLGMKDLKVEPYDDKNDGVKNPLTGMAYPYIDIKAQGSFFGTELEWEMYASTSTFKIQPSKFTEAFTSFYNMYLRKNKLPLLAFYSDSFPHIEFRNKNKDEKKKVFKDLRNFGYFEWNEETACSSVWIERYEKAWHEWDRLDRRIKDWEESLAIYSKKYEEEKTDSLKVHIANLEKTLKSEPALRKIKEKEILAIKDCLRKFTKDDPDLEVNDLFVDVDENTLHIRDASGKAIPFLKLPAGYKRLLYIVFDIAYRSYILNGDTQSSGIVIIDEIDLHLHPSLEQSVLQRLRDTFPNVQFIVSTHSALVIANLDASKNAEGIQNNKVYMMQMGDEEPTALPNLFGVDYNAAMRDFMKTPDRNRDIKRLIDEFLTFRTLDMKAEAGSTFNKIKDILGSDNETVISEINKKASEL